MSAAEIIEMIKKLPPEVVAFVKKTEPAANESAAKYASDAEFDQALKQVVTENSELLRRLAQ